MTSNIKDNKLKVLLCSPSEKNGVGGIAKWTGHILAYSKSDKDVQIEQFYSESTTMNQGAGIFLRFFYGIKNYCPFLIALKNKLKYSKYNVVHLCTSASLSLIRDLLSILIAKKYGCKVIIHFRFGRIPEILHKRNWEYWFIDKVIRMSDMAIVIDDTSYESLVNNGYSNVCLLPNPISDILLSIIDKYKTSIDRIPNKLVFAGHVIESKGIIELVKACSLISGIKLNIIGRVSDEMRNKLEKMVETNTELLLNIVGEKDSEYVIKEMLSAGIFVLPTYTEGFPNVILESMACSCPIISTNVGAIPEMLDITSIHKCGICVKPKDVNALKNAILKMLNDRDYAKKCGDNAAKQVRQKYSMPVVWNKLKSIWNFE